MNAAPLLAPPALEHLTPHDLVTYFRCPYEMELGHAARLARLEGRAGDGVALPGVRTPLDVVPLHHSPLAPPPALNLPFNDGRLDVFPDDRLIYRDEGEAEELPMLFAPEQQRTDPLFQAHGGNLIDPVLGLSGRPDFILRRRAGALVPVEYKSTHPFRGLHETHGRTFDLIQLLAECQLVEAVSHTTVPYGILLYGDVAGSGEHEGWFQRPFSDADRSWIREAVGRIRTDAVRAPVPSEGTCRNCPPHREGLCRYAAGRYEGPEPARDRFHRHP
ncbi:MAG TPA: hypothetical protein VGV89_00525 [Thermoplasmata archaeon]|nr:hypothetical protein [Thermoplasmata archaeon]